jgi:hypothetical protein
MIEWIVERLIGLLGPVAKLQKDKRDLADAALRSVSEALTETCLYYRAIEDGGGTDKVREAQLVRLWAAAAIPLRHIDPDLASTCQYKSDYWLDPRSWDNAKIKRIGIDLDSVKRRFNALLAPAK